MLNKKLVDLIPELFSSKDFSTDFKLNYFLHICSFRRSSDYDLSDFKKCFIENKPCHFVFEGRYGEECDYVFTTPERLVDYHISTIRDTFNGYSAGYSAEQRSYVCDMQRDEKYSASEFAGIYNLDVFCYESYSDFFNEQRNSNEDVVIESLYKFFESGGKKEVKETIDDFVQNTFLDGSYLEYCFEALEERFFRLYDIEEIEGADEFERVLFDEFKEANEFETDIITNSSFKLEELIADYLKAFQNSLVKGTSYQHLSTDFQEKNNKLSIKKRRKI